MNYLAHLHIADITGTSVTGNLMGDFVKGRVDDLPYDDAIKKGIKLHRAVDTFTDRHLSIHALKVSLGPHRRYAGIILDVLLDHHLACNFSKFHSLTLSEFSQQVYRQVDVDDEGYPERFVIVCQRMQQMDWLSGYCHLEKIEKALVGISQRLKRPVDLTEAMGWHRDNYQRLNETFLEFYADVLRFAQAHSVKL